MKDTTNQEAKRGRGRPREIEEATRMTFDLPLSVKEGISILAKENKMPMSALLRVIAEEHVEYERTRRPSLFATEEQNDS